MDVHLVDGTYELFRHFFGVPSRKDAAGREVGAIRSVLNSMVLLLEGGANQSGAGAGGTNGATSASQNGATHVAVATDHVIKSFRNDLWDDYKDGSEIDPLIAEQFEPLEQALQALGLCVWPMVEFEADDALAAGAAMAAADKRVQRVLICTPDKDLAQCVGGKVVQWDRRKDLVFDTNQVQAKFGVLPESIPDYLALVGDAADGFPGLPGWGAKSAAAVLGHYRKLEAIPETADDWQVQVRGSAKLASTLAEQRERALLFRQIATVRTDAPVSQTVDELRWTGPATGAQATAGAQATGTQAGGAQSFAQVCERIGAEQLIERVAALTA